MLALFKEEAGEESQAPTARPGWMNTAERVHRDMQLTY